MSEPDAENVLTVTQLTRRVRGVLEGEIGQVWVEGEISNHRLQSSGHHYFTLKDEGAQISCVLFRGAALRMGTRLGDGVQVQLLGSLSVYEPRGQYQLVVKLVQPKGQGVLQARFEALKRKLDAEGLFDQGLKQPLPAFPSVIALVTSPTGAAIRDMLNILSRRAPWVRLLVLPVRVQGNGAEREIAQAIAALNRAEEMGLPKPDVMIVGRGGGSLEDLWNFNEEVVARAIYASQIPVISAVGHEIDFTIADFVADLRAPTPSAAAELVVPDGNELLRHLEGAQRAMQIGIERTLEHHAQVLDLTMRGALMREPARVVQQAEQSTDDLEQRWRSAATERLRELGDRVVTLAAAHARHHPAKVVSDLGHRMDMQRYRLQQAMRSLITRHEDRVEATSRQLTLVGPQSILARGFSFTTDAEGNTILDAQEVRPGTRLITQLAKGELRSVAE